MPFLFASVGQAGILPPAAVVDFERIPKTRFRGWGFLANELATVAGGIESGHDWFPVATLTKTWMGVKWVNRSTP